MTTGRRTRRGAAQGYTLIEVMMAIGIMTVGAVGIMALQQATIRGNTFARQMSVATEFNRTWVERIRRDAVQWNAEGLAGVGTTDYLKFVPAAAGTVGPWFTPNPTPARESFAADWFGQDTRATGQMFYCTNLRLRWVIGQEAIRADVRTWWRRTTQSSSTEYSDQGLFPGCGVGSENDITAELNRTPTSRLHAVYSSFLVRWTPIEGT